MSNNVIIEKGKIMEQKKLMSQTEFASFYGCSQCMVNRYIRTKKIEPHSLIQGEKYQKIWAEQAVKDLKKNLNQSKRNNSPKKKAGLTPDVKEKKQFIKNHGVKLLPYDEAQKVEKNYQALLKQLEYEESSGKTMSIKLVGESSFNSHRLIKEQVSAIPARCAPLVAPESDQFECEQILKKETDYILNHISDTLKVMK